MLRMSGLVEPVDHAGGIDGSLRHHTRFVPPGSRAISEQFYGSVRRARGARVIAGVTSKEKGEVALRSGGRSDGAGSAGNLRKQVFALTQGRGVDAVIDPVGGDVFDAALRAVAYAGRMVIVGFASGRIPEIMGHYILLKNISVVGAPLDIHFKMEPEIMDAAVSDLFRMYESGDIRPEIMATYPLDEIHAAMD